MKANINNYKNYYGPYQLAQTLMFWVPKEKDEYGIPMAAVRVHRFGEWLAHGSIRPEPEIGDPYLIWGDRPLTWLHRLLLWVDKKRTRRIDVRIDPWDTWSMDTTLGYIIRPMLHELNKNKNGAPFVDAEDVPEHLRPTEEEVQEFMKSGSTDDKHFERWDWVIGEMIFAFESLDGGANQDWENQFTTGKYDFRFEKIDERGTSRLVNGPNHTAETDWEGRKAYGERIQNGFRLFGKYFQSLWS
jgi:hypothetical protein